MLQFCNNLRSKATTEGEIELKYPSREKFGTFERLSKNLSKYMQNFRWNIQRFTKNIQSFQWNFEKLSKI